VGEREGEFGVDFKFYSDAKVGSWLFRPRVITASTFSPFGNNPYQLCKAVFSKYQTLALGEMFEKHHCRNPGLSAIDRPD
jgi:hypothetical protein